MVHQRGIRCVCNLIRTDGCAIAKRSRSHDHTTVTLTLFFLCFRTLAHHSHTRTHSRKHTDHGCVDPQTIERPPLIAQVIAERTLTDRTDKVLRLRIRIGPIDDDRPIIDQCETSKRIITPGEHRRARTPRPTCHTGITAIAAASRTEAHTSDTTTATKQPRQVRSRKPKPNTNLRNCIVVVLASILHICLYHRNTAHYLIPYMAHQQHTRKKIVMRRAVLCQRAVAYRLHFHYNDGGAGIIVTIVVVVVVLNCVVHNSVGRKSICSKAASYNCCRRNLVWCPPHLTRAERCSLIAPKHSVHSFNFSLRACRTIRIAHVCTRKSRRRALHLCERECARARTRDYLHERALSVTMCVAAGVRALSFWLSASDCV